MQGPYRKSTHHRGRAYDLIDTRQQKSISGQPVEGVPIVPVTSEVPEVAAFAATVAGLVRQGLDEQALTAAVQRELTALLAEQEIEGERV